MAMLGLVVLGVTLIITNMVTMASSASLVTYIFGDSLTEVGNNNFLQYSLAKSNFPYYGIDYPGGRPTGRFTNGRTIGDIISARLGIPSPPAYLSLSPNDDALLKGVNYASGGAGILNDTGLYFIQRLSFDDQIKNFEKTKQAIKAKIGEEKAEKLCNEAMYFIGIGSNDYVNNFLQPFLPDETPPTGCKKDGVPWARPLRLHSFTKGEIKERAVLKARFKVSNTSCCHVDTSIGGLCLPNSKVCSNRTEYVFWDAFHPSDAANAILAEKFFSSLFSNATSPSGVPSH
ncbi:hypothetical protein TEA_027154 [Camellia sinensis var. sinensis]|uniref:Uncharacterized protein n=1 Tax=Camellia sinensis var. sinensis TaxID=542762 RepID=A0A4S4E1Y4_CAMSN|nr:hypothetical protein TEA_027154 [Camellia sinensis var. sinensis]